MTFRTLNSKNIVHTNWRFILIVLFSTSFTSFAQIPIKKTVETIDSIVNTSLEKDMGIIPAPVFNPAFGTGIAVLPVFVYRPKGFDKETHPSTSQGILFLNFTGSYLAGAKQTLYLNKNKFWIDAYLGYASMKFKYYDNIDTPEDDYREITFQGFVSNVSFLINLKKYFYLGPIFSSNYIKENAELPDGLEQSFEWYHTPGLKTSYDSRDNIFYPVEGWFSTLALESLIKSESQSYDFNKITVGVSNYKSLTLEGDKIIASRIYTQLGYGNLPLHEMASPGASPILRGYITGNFLNSSILTAQAEFRWMFSERWGTVGFLGYGILFDQPHQLNDNLNLPSIGAGMRYRIFPKFKINVALDVAFGRKSANMYFSLSESF